MLNYSIELEIIYTLLGGIFMAFGLRFLTTDCADFRGATKEKSA
jgi:hypothetical protein